MNDIITASPIFDENNLQKSRYLISLMTEARRCGLCTDEEYSVLEEQIYESLSAQILLYTSGKSTSLEAEKVAQLLGSLLYSADLALLKLTPSEAISRIFTEPFWNICEEGRKLISAYTLKSLGLLKKVQSTRIKTSYCAYNRMLDSELKNLIRSYDTRFDARRSLITVHYHLPTVNKSVRGIGGMLHLLEEVYAENIFVNSFSSEEFKALQFRNECELTNPFGGTIINLGQLCFEQALLSMMAGNPAGRLILSNADCHVLSEKYSPDTAYTAAVKKVHLFSKYAPEQYFMKLLSKFRVTVSALFLGGEAAIRNFAGFRD